MKRGLFILLFAIVFILSGCGAGGTSPAPEAGSPTEGAINTDDDTVDDGEGEAIKLSGEITISPMYSATKMKSAAARFMDAHPGVKIIVEDGPVYDNTTDEDILNANYASKVQMDMMTGTASDIIEMGIYYEYYELVDNRLITDIEQLMKNDPEESGDLYYTNVLDAMRYKGGVYVFPTLYTYRLVGYNKDLAGDIGNQWNGKDKVSLIDLLNIYQSIPEETRERYFVEPSYSFSIVAYTQIQDYVDFANKTCAFDNPEFIDLIKQISKIIDPDIWEGGYYTRDYYPPADEMGVASKHAFLHIDNSEYQFLYGITNLSFDEFKPLLDGSGKMTMMPSESFAITESSKNKELAWEFLKYYSSPESMLDTYIYGMPIRKDTFELLINTILERLLDTAVKDGYLISQTKEEAIETAKDKLREYNSMPMNFSRPGYGILSIFREEFDNYRQGLISAEQTASSIQNKVYLYLNQ